MHSQQAIARIKQRLADLNHDQKWLADRLAVDQSTVSRILSGERPLQPEVIRETSIILRDLTLRQIWMSETGAAVLPTPPLNNIDTTPASMQLKLTEEVDELAEILTEDNLCNIFTDADLRADSDLDKWFDRLTDCLVDVHTGIEAFFVSCYALYGRDPEQAAIHWSHKVRSRGYIKPVGRSNVTTMVFADTGTTGGGGMA